MKRSSTSLVSNEEKTIIGLIFGCNTKHDLYRNAEVILKAFDKAKEMNGSVHFLKQCEDIQIQRQIEYVSEIQNVSCRQYYPKPQEFGGSIRAARKVCIDAILSESYCTYFLTVDNDATCTLTGIRKNPRLSYNIDVTYVRTLEKIKEEDAKVKEEHWRMETKKEFQKHVLNIGLIFGHETGYDRGRICNAIEKAFKKAEEMNGVVHFLQLCDYPHLTCEFKYFSEAKNVPFYEHVPQPEAFGGSLIAAQKAYVDIILSETYYTQFVTVQNDPKCILTRIYNDTSLPYRLNVTYVRASIQMQELEVARTDTNTNRWSQERKDALKRSIENAKLRCKEEIDLNLRCIVKKIKI